MRSEKAMKNSPVNVAAAAPSCSLPDCPARVHLV
jgi:hypothetical protein